MTTSAHVQELTTATFDVALAGDKPLIVDFWAPWCGPCRALAPIVSDLAHDLEGRVVVASVNTDEHPQLAARYGVSSIPFVARFDGGELTARSVGLRSKAALADALGVA